MGGAKKSFYDIAVDFKNSSDEDIEKLKFHIIQQIGDQYEWKSSDDIKIMCRKEWAFGTFIDIYVIYQGNMVHLCIDRGDVVQLPLDDFFIQK